MVDDARLWSFSRLPNGPSREGGHYRRRPSCGGKSTLPCGRQDEQGGNHEAAFRGPKGTVVNLTIVRRGIKDKLTLKGET